MFIQILYMFRATMCSSSGESVVSIHLACVTMQVTVWYAGMFGNPWSFIYTCIPDGHLHRVTYARCRIDTIDSPDDEYLVARNMQSIEITIRKRIVPQVGYFARIHVGVFFSCGVIFRNVRRISKSDFQFRHVHPVGTTWLPLDEFS